MGHGAILKHSPVAIVVRLLPRKFGTGCRLEKPSRKGRYLKANSLQ